jgi:Transposase
METLVERGCGLDVHQATVVACLLIVSKSRKVHKEIRTFGTTTRELLALREWLRSQGCTHVAMESTGVYWKPVYAILEGEGTFKIVVANAQHVKKVPGRKTDVKDAEWIAELLCHGLLRSSFVPQAHPGVTRLDALPPQAGGKPSGRAQSPAEAAGKCQHQVSQRGRGRFWPLRSTDAASTDRRKSEPAGNG